MTEQVQGAATLRDITIQGHDFEIEVPYATGHQLTEKEASQLNQVYLENIGNNFRTKVKEMLEGGSTTDAIQAELDKYAADYEFGTRRTSGGPRKAADPVQKEMHALARKALTEFFAKKDVKYSDLSADEKAEAMKTYLDRHGDKIRPIAERRVADAAVMAESGI